MKNIIKSVNLFYMFLFSVFVLMVCILIKSYHEDTTFMQNQAAYDQAKSYYNSKEYEPAQEIIGILKKKYPENESVSYISGITAAALNQPEKGIEDFRNALNINPYLIENPTFIIAFAELLMMDDSYEDAQIMLKVIKEIMEKQNITDPALIQKTDEIEVILYESI